MKWLFLLIFGISTNNVVLVNHTGLKIVRIIIGDLRIEETNNQLEQILVNVAPGVHNMTLVFKGGAKIDWDNFDFSGIHQIIFTRVKNRVNATYD